MFGERFDKSLCLMLESDKSNRREIVEFIKLLPKDLIKLVNEKLVIFEEYFNGKRSIYDNDSMFCLSDSVIIDMYMYSFIIDMIEGSISIRKSINSGNGFSIEKELILNIETSYNSVLTVGKQGLGSYNNRDYTINYYLINTMFGLMVVNSNGIISKHKRVRIEDCYNLQMDNFFNKNGFSRVRKNIR